VFELGRTHLLANDRSTSVGNAEVDVTSRVVGERRHILHEQTTHPLWQAAAALHSDQQGHIQMVG